MISHKLKSASRYAVSKYAFGFAFGLFIGVLGGVAERPLIGVVCAGFLTMILAGFHTVFNRTLGVFTGITSGALLGIMIAVGLIAFGGLVGTGRAGVMFGLTRGGIMGGVLGFLTRAETSEDDPWHVSIFLAVGSFVVGAILGGVVGAFSGFLLGALRQNEFAAAIGGLLGGIVGGYLVSSNDNPRLIAAGAIVGAILTGLGTIIGGSVNGVFLGAISGSIVPILFMMIIGMYGGLHRGPKALLLEAAQTPREMLAQGAIPMIAPAMLIGVIVGTAVVGIRAILVIPTILALVGIFLGALGELEGLKANRVSPKAIVEILILGLDRWPWKRLVNRLRNQRVDVLKASLLGFLVGLAGSGIGMLFGPFLANLFN
ncbi:MAG: hypothetical protein AAF490_15215 [Chloroflexota bacterium]